MIVEEERFKGQRGLKEGVYPHHLFHVYPLVVLQNLLPSVVTIETEVKSFVMKNNYHHCLLSLRMEDLSPLL